MTTAWETEEAPRAPQRARRGVAVAVNGLSFSYSRDVPSKIDGNLVLHDVTLELPAGKVTTLLGPNGSGKTTLMRLILGLMKPGAGSVLVDGQSPGQMPRASLGQTMALVPQDESLVFDLPVLDYVLLGRAPHLGILAAPSASDREIALAALEEVGIAELRDRPATALSGGERQLATIARALAQEPGLLLMDEPTSHLDLANQRRVLGVIRGLRETGVTVLLTTHDPNAAVAIADQIVLLRDGRLLAAGEPARTLTAERLSATYGVPVSVVSVEDKLIVLSL